MKSKTERLSGHAADGLPVVNHPDRVRAAIDAFKTRGTPPDRLLGVTGRRDGHSNDLAALRAELALVEAFRRYRLAVAAAVLR